MRSAMRAASQLPAFCNTFDHFPLRSLFCLFLSGRLGQVLLYPGSHRLEKYLNIQDSLEKSLKMNLP